MSECKIPTSLLVSGFITNQTTLKISALLTVKTNRKLQNATNVKGEFSPVLHVYHYRDLEVNKMGN